MMQRSLIRVLSTGRTGTRFLASLFSELGFNAYHEDFYAGEPGVALHAYTNLLGDMWIKNPAQYFQFHSSFADVYMKTLLSQFGPVHEASPFWKRPKRNLASKNFVIECGHNMTLATPLIHAQLQKFEIAPKYFILYRNPLRTIHALFKAESAQGYPYRPSGFHQSDGMVGAAEIWKNSYLHILDLRDKLGAEYFHLLDLQDFTDNLVRTREAFDFAGIGLDQQAFVKFRSKFSNEPIRTSKYETIRNSDLFRDLDFVFDQQQIDEINLIIDPVLKAFSIKAKAMVEDYKRFHENEKKRNLAATL